MATAGFDCCELSDLLLAFVSAQPFVGGIIVLSVSLLSDLPHVYDSVLVTDSAWVVAVVVHRSVPFFRSRMAKRSVRLRQGRRWWHV